jgi:hypothetical protein
MIPTSYNLPDAYRGDSYGPIIFNFTDINGSGINLSGVSACLQAKDPADLSTPVIQWSTSDGSINISGNQVTLNALSGTFLQVPAMTYNYDLQIISGGVTETFINGTWNIYQDVTQL